jgi:hypothetical protein
MVDSLSGVNVSIGGFLHLCQGGKKPWNKSNYKCSRSGNADCFDLTTLGMNQRRLISGVAAALNISPRRTFLRQLLLDVQKARVLP